MPPQGAIENKVIEVNKTLAAADGTIILKETKIWAAQIQIKAIYAPQGYVMPAETGNVSTPPKIDALAEYGVDSNTLKSAGPAFDRWVEEGRELEWVINEPVPIDSRELKFRITSIEKHSEQKQWEGPWEFTIQLQ